MHFTIVICTKDRPFEIDRLLGTIEKQTRRPDHIIISDGSDNPVDKVVKKYDFCSIDYVKVRPPSLPRQRNVAISRIPDASEWIGFLDDDLILFEDCFQEIQNSINRHDEHEKLGGVGIVVDNHIVDSQGEGLLSTVRRLFLLDTKKGGKFTLSGCPTRYKRTDGDQLVEWLSGGISFWKKEVLDNYAFDEWFAGTGYYEDVDFAYRVSRDYRLYLASMAKCHHLDHAIRKEKLIPYGLWQITAWWYLVRKVKSFNYFFVLWSMLGLTVNNIVMGILNPSSNRLRIAFGNIKGLGTVFIGKALIKKGFSK